MDRKDRDARNFFYREMGHEFRRAKIMAAIVAVASITAALLIARQKRGTHPARDGARRSALPSAAPATAGVCRGAAMIDMQRLHVVPLLRLEEGWKLRHAQVTRSPSRTPAVAKRR